MVRLSQPVPPYAFAARYGRGADPEPLNQLSFERKQQLFALTAASGDLENVATLVARMESPFWWSLKGAHHRDACAAAARRGHMHVARWLLARSCPLDADATVTAAMRHCSLADAQWLLTQEPVQRLPAYQDGRLPRHVVEAAASSTTPDSLAKLEWLLAGDKGDTEPIAKAAASGAASIDNLPALQHVLRWASDSLHADRLPGIHEDALVSAAGGGATGVTQWLLGQGQVDMSGVVWAAQTAAWKGRTETLAMLLPAVLQEAAIIPFEVIDLCLLRAGADGQAPAIRLIWEQAEARGLDVRPCFDVAFKDVAGSGAVDVAAWLWQRRPQQVSAGALRAAMVAAANSGSLPMLTFLRDEAGAPWGVPIDMVVSTIYCASRGRDGLAVLRWLRERGCELGGSAEALARAARVGTVALTEWLREHGLIDRGLLDREALLKDAACGGCGAMIEWLLAAGCPAGREGLPYIEAGRQGDLDTLRCLRRLGVPVGWRLVARAMDERLPAHAVRWMVEEGGAACDRRAAKQAARVYEGEGGAALVEYLRAAAELHDKR